MVGDDGDRVFSSLQILVPFFKRKNDRKQFPVVDVVISLGGGEGARKVGARVKVLIGVGLKENGSRCEERCIGHDGKWLGHIWDKKYGAEEKMRFSSSNAFCCNEVQFQGSFFLVSKLSSATMLEKLGMNFL